MTEKMKRIQKLKDAGYQAALHGKPCDAPTNSERERAAWEQGWRAGNNEWRAGNNERQRRQSK